MSKTVDLQKIEEEEKRILAEARKIEAAEERISQEEEQILAAEKSILKNFRRPALSKLIENGLTRRELYFLRAIFIGKIIRHKFIFTLLVTAGIVLVWRGVWHTADDIPILSYSLVSLLVG